jgi:hypothetical protein
VATRRIRLISALIALLAPAAECQPGGALWRFVDPGAKALVSIDWGRIRLSPLGAMIRDKWLNPDTARAIPGIELLDTVDRVVISSTGAEGQAAESPLLIALRGHFERGTVRRLFARLGARPQAYNSFQVYRPRKSAQDMAYVLFDAGTILFGDAPSLFAALDRSQFAPPAPQTGSILARAAEMESTYDLWLSIQTPDMVANDRLSDLLHSGDWAADAQGFEAGVNLHSGLAADVTLRFASEASAKQVVTELTQLIAAASKDRATESELREIARKLKFASEGTLAKIDLRLTPQELEKSAAAFAAAHPAAPFKPAAAPVQAVAPPPPARGVIRIEGLDGGPREIPYPEPH